MRGGDFIQFADKIWLVMQIAKHHEDPMKNRCALIDAVGEIKWFHTVNVYPEAKILSGRRASYIDISQFNYNDKHEHRVGNQHKAPVDYAQAQDWADEMGGIYFVDHPRMSFGFGSYSVQLDGKLKFESAEWDSSD